MDGSQIDLDGDGTVYGYNFLSSQEGSYDQIALDGVSVIVPYNASLPGDAVYLEGSDLIAQGLYSLLPEGYAFLTGAIIIEHIGTADTGSYAATTQEGYTLVTGYQADALTGYRSAEADLFSVRVSSDVLAEGQYELSALVTGDAGTLTVNGTSTVLNSTVSAAALNDNYKAGSIGLSAENIIVTANAYSGISGGFGRDSDLSLEYKNKLYISDDFLSGGNFTEITLGSVDAADVSDTLTIDFEAGARVTVTDLNLNAVNNITLGSGASITGSGQGAVEIYSKSGILDLKQGAQGIYASRSLGLIPRESKAIRPPWLRVRSFTVQQQPFSGG